MFCTKCGTRTQDSAKFCHACGTRVVTALSQEASLTVSPSVEVCHSSGKEANVMWAVSEREVIVTVPWHVGDRVTVNFTGKALSLFGRTLLVGLLRLLILPAPWITAWFCKWIVGKLRLSDGTTASFQGRGSEIWFAFIIPAVLGAAATFANLGTAPEKMDGAMLLASILPFIMLFFLDGLFWLMILKWQVRSVKLSSGASFTFTGRYWSNLGWWFLWLVSIFSVVGWAWVNAAYCRWLCRKIDGGQCHIEFTGTGWNILWRTTIVLLSCILIVPIPWTGLWLINWYVRNISISQATGGTSV